jgi:toxin-antitoxin system PIN domain toxin
LNRVKHLLDVNVLMALTQPEHLFFKTATEWFNTPGLDWGLCAFSEAGFLRLSANPNVGKLTVEDATAILAALVKRPGYRFWPVTADWASLARPFSERVFGHRQITDAYLLGLAVKENAVLVTTDKAIRHMAGVRYSAHLLVLEPPAE